MTPTVPFSPRPHGCGQRLRFLSDTDSTNRQARLWAEEGAEDGSVVLADHQTAGRGRFDRVWAASRGQNLLLTLILRRPLPRPAWLPLATGLAARNAVASLLPTATVSLKWPNDVRIDGRKVAGILVESPAEGLYLVGIGPNRSFPTGWPHPRRPCCWSPDNGSTVKPYSSGS